MTVSFDLSFVSIYWFNFSNKSVNNYHVFAGPLIVEALKNATNALETMVRKTIIFFESIKIIFFFTSDGYESNEFTNKFGNNGCEAIGQQSWKTGKIRITCLHIHSGYVYLHSPAMSGHNMFLC